MQLADRVLVLPRSIVRLHQRISEDLEQLAVQPEAPRGHRRLRPHDVPEPIEWHPGGLRPLLGGSHLGESRERIARHRGPHDRALEDERGADDGQSVLFTDDHYRAGVGLTQAAARAFDEQTGVESVFPEQCDERRGVRRARTHLRIGAEQLHA